MRPENIRKNLRFGTKPRPIPRTSNGFNRFHVNWWEGSTSGHQECWHPHLSEWLPGTKLTPEEALEREYCASLRLSPRT